MEIKGSKDLEKNLGKKFKGIRISDPARRPGPGREEVAGGSKSALRRDVRRPPFFRRLLRPMTSVLSLCALSSKLQFLSSVSYDIGFVALRFDIEKTVQRIFMLLQVIETSNTCKNFPAKALPGSPKTCPEAARSQPKAVLEPFWAR